VSRALLSLGLLTLVYALALASFHPFDLLLGALLSAALLAGLRRFLFGGRPAAIGGLAGRAAALPLLVWAILRDITVGTWRVALVVLGARPLERPGIVAVPLEERSHAGVVVSAFTATLSPGEFLVEIDWPSRRMLVHVLDARDPEAVRARFADFYRRYQRRVVP
jgi:multisubunit Na+/H+ antiporter MnhE subunit